MKKMQIFIFVISLICFLGSAGYLGKYFWERHISAQNMQEVRSLLIEETGAEDDEAKENGILKKYARLYAENPDFAGWIQIPNTTIDYPVMYVKDDNDRYLYSNFKREYDGGGTPFIDGRCSLDPVSDHLIIYGHHMNDNSMFQPLMNYKKEAFYKDHKRIYFDTVHETGTYEIVAVILAQALSADEEGFRYYGEVDFEDEAAFNNYMANIRSLQLYETETDAVFGDSLITLSTCEYSQENSRLAVIAKRVSNKKR